eukprot:893109-Pleurochrysis_carterae.AAC.2
MMIEVSSSAAPAEGERVFVSICACPWAHVGSDENGVRWREMLKSEEAKAVGRGKSMLFRA